MNEKSVKGWIKKAEKVKDFVLAKLKQNGFEYR